MCIDEFADRILVKGPGAAISMSQSQLRSTGNLED